MRKEDRIAKEREQQRLKQAGPETHAQSQPQPQAKDAERQRKQSPVGAQPQPPRQPGKLPLPD